MMTPLVGSTIAPGGGSKAADDTSLGDAGKLRMGWVASVHATAVTADGRALGLQGAGMR
jgi:hypothetical protein